VGKPNETTVRRDGGGATPEPRRSLVFFHRDGTKVAPLPERGSLVVGRQHPADLVVIDPSLSRQHAAFVVEPDRITVEDLGSTNGTFVSGQRATTAMPVHVGDELRLGDVLVTLTTASVLGAGHGIERHDRFLGALADELVRARAFGRPVALVMLEVRGASIARWAPLVRTRMRAVDRLGAYSLDTALVLLPELDEAGAIAAARALVAEAQLEGAEVRCGVAVGLRDGTDAESLLEVARTRLRLARDAGAIEGPLPDGAPTRPSRAPGPLDVASDSPAVRAVHETLAQVATTTLPVLVLGETGAGKERIAAAVHERSGRTGPFKSLNCGALPGTLLESALFGHEKGAFTGADRTHKGVFEQAQGGTVFLDEVGELSPAAQAALLRVLETRRVSRVGSDREIEVDVRIVAATHRDLEAMTTTGGFRTDLLYRLNAVVLALPPLRERREDVRALAQAFLARAAHENARGVRGFTDEALRALTAYAWPGNVRELRNVVERAVVVAREARVGVDDLPDRVRGGGPMPSAPPPEQPVSDDEDFADRVRAHTQAYEKRLIEEALAAAGGNQTEAARRLRMPIRTLTHKMQQLGVRRPR